MGSGVFTIALAALLLGVGPLAAATVGRLARARSRLHASRRLSTFEVLVEEFLIEDAAVQRLARIAPRPGWL